MSIPAWMRHYPDAKAYFAICMVNVLTFSFSQTLVWQGFPAVPVYLCGVAIALLLFLLIQWLDYRSWRSTVQSSRTTSTHNQHPHRYYEEPETEDSVDPQLVHRLLCLMHGDEDAAWRLYERELERNPHKSEQWCMEKAIRDLIRDRSR